MSRTGLSIERRLRALLGPNASIERDNRGIPTVAPGTTDACALILRAAAAEGWRVQIAGHGTWSRSDGPADLTVTSSGLSLVEEVRPADLVATVQAGVDREALRVALADHGVWWPVDPPGTRRSLGSVVATATAGPLRSGFGGVRDHVLGLTVVTAGGRVVRSGGRVVKNVAGFDLTKLATGSFSAFGMIASAHLRLRAIPRADVTLLVRGERDNLVQHARAILDAGLTPAGLELLSPAPAGHDRWTLAVRLMGSDPAVTAERNAVQGIGSLQGSELPPSHATEFWQTARQAPVQHPVTLRLGTLLTGLDQTLDLITHHLDDEVLSASVAAGTVRWSGAAEPDRIRLLRKAAAQIEVPVTVERGPWKLRGAVGHFGAYREGVSRLMGSLRTTFDPDHTIVTAFGTEG